MSQRRTDLFHKLYWREVNGCIKAHSRAKKQKLFNKLPGRLGYRLKDLVPRSILEDGCIFLGFTKNGQFIVSYTVQFSADLPMYMQYRLQIWLFVPQRPCQLIDEIKLFGEERILSELDLVICEWPRDDSKILVYGASDSTLCGESHCYVTIASMPSLACCQDCLVEKSSDGERTVQKCVRHSLAVHTKYESTPPHPPFIPQIHLQINGVVVLNTGDSIIAVEVKAASELIENRTINSSVPGEVILTNTDDMECALLCCDSGSDISHCEEDPLDLDSSDKVDCDYSSVPYHHDAKPHCDPPNSDSHYGINSCPLSQRSNHCYRFGDEVDCSPRPICSPRIIHPAVRSSEDKENADHFHPCSPLTASNGNCDCSKLSIDNVCLCPGESINSPPKFQEDPFCMSSNSPRSSNSSFCGSPQSPKPFSCPRIGASAWSPKNSGCLLIRSPRDVPHAAHFQSHSGQELLTLSDGRHSSQRSFFSPPSSTCSTRDSVVLYLNNPEFVALVFSRFTFPTNDDVGDNEDVRELNYHSMMPLTVTCSNVNLRPVKTSSSSTEKFDVAVKQLTLDIEHYLGDVIRNHAVWGSRFIDVMDYDAQVLTVCGTSFNVLCKVDVWIHARQEIPHQPMRNNRKVPVNLYKTNVTYEWCISTGCLNTIHVDDIQQIDERSWRLSRSREVMPQTDIHRLRKWASRPQSYYQSVRVLTNKAALKGQSLPMLLDTQHYVAIIL